MSKFMILAKKSYIQKVTSKSFLFGTLIYLLILTGAAFWPQISDALFNDEAQQITVLNDTDANLEELLISNADFTYTFSDESVAAIEQQITDDPEAIALHIRDEDGVLHADLMSYDPLPLNDETAILSTLDYANKIYAVQQLNLSAADANNILNAQPVTTTKILNVDIENDKSEGEKTAGVWISYVVGIIIFAFIMMYLTMIITEVASEKGSRALEMLLVSIKPTTHFNAKIISIFALALTQGIVIVGYAFLIFSLVGDGDMLSVIQDIFKDISGEYIFFTVAFLILTILLYLIIGALFGSLVAKVEEANQVMSPIMMVTLAGFYIMLSGTWNPDTLLIKISSFIPLISGMVLPLRLSGTNMSSIEAWISLGILVATIVIVYMVSMSFYKRAVLTYSTGGVLQKIKTIMKVTS
ncbi:ABC transporter permease [Caryophanon tenue]|uniref:Sodium ABC transporter permease n=1 Tax=Caryophanon tenue TaxID=33978 RepID=A0A1C0Y772_9BACL|nr:ABC transporter permease [Caryophanon tenue]OCS83001.1 sodium ABC transporter permease [Caryophanon tenue]